MKQVPVEDILTTLLRVLGVVLTLTFHFRLVTHDALRRLIWVLAILVIDLFSNTEVLDPPLFIVVTNYLSINLLIHDIRLRNHEHSRNFIMESIVFSQQMYLVGDLIYN